MFESDQLDQDNVERLKQGHITQTDFYFARYLASKCQINNPIFFSLFADLSHSLTEQHSCLDLSQYPNNELMQQLLIESNCVSQGQAEDEDPTPLVLEGNLLFLHKYYQYECRIAKRLLAKNKQLAVIDHSKLQYQLSQHFQFGMKKETESQTTSEIDWQLVAAYQALTNSLTIITGGPGTGKTTTVFKILSIWAELQAEEILPGDIRLAAPTGKAAMRLSESLLRSSIDSSESSIKSHSGISPATVSAEKVVTIHRLLGYRPQDNSYRHNARNPLRAKLLIIDEASMLDLAMLDRLLAAIPTDCQLVLIGDPNQLPSVEAGNALMDLCRHKTTYSNAFAQQVERDLGLTLPHEESHHGLSNSICRLTQSHRFSDTAGIGRTAHAILNGESIEANEDVVLNALPDLKENLSPLVKPLETYLNAITQQESQSVAQPEEMLSLFESSQILCPVREGPLGVVAINNAIEQYIFEKGQILYDQQSKPRSWLNTEPMNHYYYGRPIMILRNDYNLALFNGDIGICVLDDSKSAHGVAFRKPDGEIQIYPISRLPQHETCFAMTIHKAQGSEFNHVSLVLGSDLTHSQENLMTRELLYTAITRSKKTVAIFSEPQSLQHTLRRRINRASGLSSRLLAS